MPDSLCDTTHVPAAQATSFSTFMRHARTSGDLVVQPRMGFGTVDEMHRGLAAVKGSDARCVGTLTVDSFTRVRDYAAVDHALLHGYALNGYPLVTVDSAETRHMLSDVRGPGFCVQVRHGAALPQDIVTAMLAAGLDATEGGPVSYCLPYSRVPLRQSVDAWASACSLLAAARTPQVEPHLETFGGCMLGQLCPPDLLVALSILEGLFFREHGLRDISLSYAQQINWQQDLEALAALGDLARHYLPELEWHIVVYTYMGLFPTTPHGTRAILNDAAQLATAGGAARLIVKTPAEAHRLPTIAENIGALEFAHRTAAAAPGTRSGMAAEGAVRDSAKTLVESVLGLGVRIGDALCRAFAQGVLDVPYCLHPDNRGATRSYIDEHGRLAWADVGGMPLRPKTPDRALMSSSDLLRALSYVRRRYDERGHRHEGPDLPANGIRGLGRQADSALRSTGRGRQDDVVHDLPQ